MMKKGLIVLFVAVVLMAVTSIAQAGYVTNITLDGQNTSNEWDSITPVIDNTDTTSVGGDITGNTNWTKGYQANNLMQLFLRGDVLGTINTTQGAGYAYIAYIDADNNKTTGYTNGWWDVGAEYKAYIDPWNRNGVNGGGLLLGYIGSGSNDTWAWLGHPTATAKRISDGENGSIVEMALNLSDLGITTGSTIGLLYRATLSVSPYGDDAIREFNQQVSYTIADAPSQPPVPEPSSLLLLGSGIVGLAAFVRKK